MSSTNIAAVVAWLEGQAPLVLAEDWDNVGLLVGDRDRPVNRLMTCLTLTPDTVSEAVDRRADLVMVHHPLPFRPLARLTTDTVVGRLLWDLIGARIAVYSAHTAFDSARAGINQRLAEGLGLEQVTPLEVRDASAAHADLGSGRVGIIARAITLAALAARVKSFLSIGQVRIVGDSERSVGRVAVACGSGGSFLPAADEQDCDCLVTGETGFHTCLEAEAVGIGLVLAGHFASERFAMERLAAELSERHPSVEVWASERERDPIQVV